MNADDPALYRLPEDRKLAAQYLLLFGMSLPDGLSLKNQINLDRSASRVVILLTSVTTREAERLKTAAEAWIAEHMPDVRKPEGTGPLVLFTHISERNNASMLYGTAMSFGLIALCLVFQLRSFRFGMLSLVPNLTPSIVAFGIWGLMVGEVGISAAVVTSVSLGLIVDNTIHFLSKYLRARRLHGDSPEDAVRYACATVGTAAWMSTAILVAGFGILALSTFQVNQVLGLLTAISIFVALLTDFFLLPPVLTTVDKDKSHGLQQSLART
jgi:predicted RND superfamily exporter protein